MRRPAKVVLAIAAVTIAGVSGFLMVFTRTDYGRERVRQIAVQQLRAMAHGTVSVERLEGNIFNRFTLVNVEIADSTGAPFLRAARIEGRVALLPLLQRRLELLRVHVTSPVVVLSQEADGRWNYQRIFSRGTAAPDSSVGFGDWVRLRDVQLRGGTLTMIRPWNGDTATSTGSDSTNGQRAVLERRGATTVRVMTFDSLNVTMAEATIADPNTQGMRFAIDSATTRAAIFRPPFLHIAHMAGVVLVVGDTVAIPQLTLVLPGSRISGSITVDSRNNNIDARLLVDTLAFADMRALYPALPDSGGGRMDLTLRLRDSMPSYYAASAMQLRVGNAEIAGSLGFTLQGTVPVFDATHLQFTRLPTSLISRVAPTVVWPFPAVLEGDLRVRGPLDALQVNLESFVQPIRHASFRLRAAGVAAVRPEIAAHGLEVHAERVPLSLLREFDVDQPVRGVLTADGTVTGALSRSMRGRMVLHHSDGASTSDAIVSGTLGFTPTAPLHVAVALRGVSLSLGNYFTDSLALRGLVFGNANVSGTLRRLQGDVALIMPGDGVVSATGVFDRSVAERPAYDVIVDLFDVQPDQVTPRVPEMLVSGRSTLRGSGSTLATLSADISTNLALLVVDSTEFRHVLISARADAGILAVDTLVAETGFARVDAQGTMGLTGAHRGSLAYALDIRDLGGLRRFAGALDSTAVEARPGVGRRLAELRDRADSVRLAQVVATDPAAALALDMQRDSLTIRPRGAEVVPALAADSIAGAILVQGTVSGNAQTLDIAATASTDGVVWKGSAFGAGTVRGRWQQALTQHDSIHVEGAVDSLRVAGFALDSTQFTANYRGGEGDLVLTLFPGDTAVYRLDTEFSLQPDHGELRLKDLALRMDSTAWTSAHPSRISWRGNAVRVDSLDLRDARAGSRLFLNGEIHAADPGRMEFIAERVRVAPWLTILQSDIRADGLLSANATVSGTTASPVLDASLQVDRAQYNGAPFPAVGGTFRYDDRALTVDVQATDTSGHAVARVSGTVPINLSLSDSVTARLPKDGVLALHVVGDSIPLSAIGQFTESIADVDAAAAVDIRVGGTWQSVRGDGDAIVTLVSARVPATGTLLRNTRAVMRLAGDTVHVDTIVAEQAGGISGSGYAVLSPLANPTMQFQLRAVQARVLDDERGRLVADADVRVAGTLDSLSVTGHATVLNGLVFIPEPQTRQIINAEDPVVYAVADSTTIRQLDVGGPGELRRNLLMDVTVDVRRGTFARSVDANVEMFGNVHVRTVRESPLLNVTGVLHTERGQYTAFGKRFDMQRGSVRFIGGETVNPSLQLIANYQVQQAGRAPLDIRVLVGGTLEKPEITLESNAQPTLSQSDLIAFLAFGQGSTALLQFSGTGLEGGGSGGSSLAGNVAALATRQLASIGIGALVDAVRSDLVSSTGADVLNITPAQLPSDVTLSGLETVLRGTEIEIGRYINARTFVLGRVRPTLTLPGASVEHRFTRQLRGIASLETRIAARPPSLSLGVAPRSRSVMGGLLTWTIGW